MVANFNLPTSTKSAADPRFKQYPKFVIFMDLMANPNAKPGITTPIHAELMEAFGQVEEQTLHAGADPAPLLKEAQATFQPKLEEVLKK
jgi:hypothetical protein